MWVGVGSEVKLHRFLASVLSEGDRLNQYLIHISPEYHSDLLLLYQPAQLHTSDCVTCGLQKLS
jgi:hypothetical protein